MRRLIVPCFLPILTLLYLPSLTLHAQSRDIKFEHLGLEHGLSQSTVYCILQDRQGFMWFGTQGGLNKFDGYNFTAYRQDVFDSTSLSQDVAWAMYEDHTGAIWAGGPSAACLNRFERDKEQFTRFVHDPKNPNSLSNGGVNAIYEDHTGTLWVGTTNGLNKFDREEEQFTRYLYDPQNPNSLHGEVVFSIYEDRSGTLWIGTFGGGLNRFDRDREQFTRFVPDSKNPHSISGSVVWSICEDSLSRNTLWIAASGGLNCFNRDTEQFTRFVNDPKNPRSLSYDYVGTLCVDRSGTLWVGTMGGGLNRFERDTGQFIHFTTKDGLSDNQVRGILADDRGRLWLSTGNGLSCFDSQAKIFRNYDMADGLVSNEFILPSQHKSAAGEMFFGSFNSGFTMFHPDSIKGNLFIPSVKNQYAYKLEGFSDNWIHLGTKRDVTFTNLDPGEYMLRVKGSNNDGVWNEEGASLKITITPPWWRTRWAYAFYVLILTILLYGWRRFELNRVKLRNKLQMKSFQAQKLQELDHMKSRFFANISHEFRTPLTLILGPVEQIRAGQFRDNLNEACDMMLRNGQRLLRLINQLLDLAKLEAGSMALHARPENIAGFLKGLVLSFASAAERKRINLTIFASEENLIVFFDRDKLEKIISNLLSNALKFTPENGKIAVAVCRGKRRGERPFAPTNECIVISVIDTGPGIPANQLNRIFDRFYQVDASHTSTSSVREHEGTGIGLALTKELVELHHGEIFVESEVGRGTTFIVRLPLGREHLKPEEVISEQLAVSSDQFLVSRDENIEVQASDHLKSTNGHRQQVEAERRSRFFGTTSNEQQGDETIILVVEDNRDVCTYIRQYLEPIFKMFEAHDGIEGVAKALEIIPDLIISDVMMPKRDGNELCRILKSDEKTSHVPIIMLTAKADSESKVQGLEIGADDYLIKPFDSRELLARVNNLIWQRQQLRKRFSREVVLKPQDIAITPMDEVFLNKVKAVVERHLSDEDFEVETLGREVGMSRMNVHRKLKALTNQSASQFIRSMRLQRAVELLKQNAGTVAEIAYTVGFGSQAYFTKCFHEQFGCAPKEYVRRNS